MALNILRQVTVRDCRPLVNKVFRRFYSLYEPDYLETGKWKVPIYPTINIQIRGYTYPLLESYQSFIHKFASVIDIDIDDSWALPPQELRVHRYKKESTAIEAEYNLKIYERNIQVSDIPVSKCAILIRILEATLPMGVSLKVDHFDPAIEEKRYVPDKTLLDLKSELSTFQRN